MTQPCQEPGCGCGDFNGTAVAPFCQTCGHAHAQHSPARAAAAACTRCSCSSFSGTSSGAFCVTCGHSSAEHNLGPSFAGGIEQAKRGNSISPLILTAIGGALLIVVVFALLIALQAGPFSGTEAAVEPAGSPQETSESAPIGFDRVAFTRGRCPLGKCPIFWAVGDGTEERPTPVKGWVDSMSADGTHLVVNRSLTDRTISEVVTLDPLRVRRADTMLTLWSPDSKWLVDRDEDASPVVTIVDVETLKPTTIALPRGETVSYPTMWWSPDSRRLLVQTSQTSGYGSGLSLVDIESGESTRIVPARRHEIDGASWSPDGSEFAYGVRDYAPAQDDGGDAPWILRIQRPGDADGEDVAEGKAPLWGRSLIAFEHPEPRSYDANGYAHDHNQIWTIDPRVGATSAKALTRFRRGAGDDFEVGPSPEAWLPDGSGLVGRLPAMESSRGFIVRLETGKLEIFRGPDKRPYYTFSFVAFSDDGKSVLADIAGFQGGDSEYVLFPVAGGPEVPYMPRATRLAVSASWNP